MDIKNENIQVNDKQLFLLETHLEGILEANKIHNLTRITSPEEAIVLHIEDSLSGLKEINEAPEGRYADLGTGGGFPGIPLAIMTGRKTLLVDSVKKKVNVLAELIESMGLSDQIGTYAGRIEDLAREQRFAFSVVTARALSSLPSLMELASPLLKRDGHLICYKAHITDEELETAQLLQKKFGMELYSKRSFMLSDGVTERCIIVFTKSGKPKVTLPRRSGMAQKNPFGTPHA
ncbi:MAG: 16S rRNA (guanine(527)-N(7))-methyltransferase RsmG [Raoultibacter sp.]